MTLHQKPALPGIDHPWEQAPATGTVTEVAPGILWARLPLPMRLDHVNAYILDDGDHWTLIDTGLDWAKGRAAWEALLAGPLAAKPVGRVILTHHHPDHIGLAGWFAGRGAEIWATRIAWLFGRMLTLDHNDLPTPQHLAFRRRAGMPENLLAAYATEKPFNFSACVAPIPLGFRAIDEGDEITMAGRQWTVRIGHGHAPSHATFWSPDGLLLAGDQVIPGISSNISVYPTEPEANPLGDWLESCARLRTHARPEHLVLPGHKLPFRGLEFRLTQLIENHEHALARIEADLDRGPMTAAEAFLAIFKRPIGASEYGLALGEAVAHMNHLLHSGRVTRKTGTTPDGPWKFTRADG
ncbi:MAG TPA: MBL fold metallo-hydrolase [Thermohalobaculum sp.]|nr:MBL fold metallo-hydrolase [Thermohalobaculum sp.]